MDSEEDDRKPAAIDPNAPILPPDGATAAVKPALKKDSTLPKNASGSSSPNNKPHKHLKWDEQAIEEHDLLRGTRMKIDEPNTPYTHYDSGAESDDSRRPKSPAHQKPTLSWDTLQTRLDSVANVREQFPPSPTSSQGGDNHTNNNNNSDCDQMQDDRKKEMERLEFKDHRKRHYNEMELVRKFRQEHPDEYDGDGDDDADDDDDGRGGDDADAEGDN